MFENILTKETSQKADSSQGIPPCRTCSSASSSPSQAGRTEVDQDVYCKLGEGAREWGDERREGGRKSKPHNRIKCYLEDKHPNYWKYKVVWPRRVEVRGTGWKKGPIESILMYCLSVFNKQCKKVDLTSKLVEFP